VRLLAGIMAVAALAAPHVRFPRDHYGHRAGIEWWYFTAYVHGSDGRRYSVFFTLFKRGAFALPVSQVVDLGNGAIVGHTENLVPAQIGSDRLDFASRVGDLSYDAASNTWTVAAGKQSFHLHFTARPDKPYVAHGGGSGTIRQGSDSSRYYSSTRMSVEGVVRNAFAFSGKAWFDHQWGNFESTPSALHWDWFSCRFDDRTELMLYRFRDGHETGTAVDRAGRGRLVSHFTATPGARVYRAAGRTWPLDWTLTVPSKRLHERLHAIVPDQLFRGALLPTFWEGAVRATGTKRGVCFVEETS
jgi:predicted secreted hydrolase